MKYDVGTIIMGALLLFVFSYIAILLVTYLFNLLMDKKKENKLSTVFVVSGIMAFDWILTTIIAIWVTSQVHVVAFVGLTAVMLFFAGYFWGKKFLKFPQRDLLIYGGLSAVLFNPGWLVLIGIL
jgi:hypothetical protein